MPKCLAPCDASSEDTGQICKSGKFQIDPNAQGGSHPVGDCLRVSKTLLLLPGAKYLGDVGQRIQNILTIKTNPRYPFTLMLTTINNNVLYSQRKYILQIFLS